MVWKETLGVPVDDEGWEALESFQSLERLASWVLECRNLVVEMGQRVDLVSKIKALKVAEEAEVDTRLSVEGRLLVQLEVMDEKVQVLDGVKQVWKRLHVAVHEVLGDRHLDLVCSRRSRKEDSRFSFSAAFIFFKSSSVGGGGAAVEVDGGACSLRVWWRLRGWRWRRWMWIV